MTRPLRAMTYNVRYANLDRGARAWSRRRDAVASTIRLHRPDLLGLQECWLDQLPDLRERLPGYEWVAEWAVNGEHVPVGYRPERLDLHDGDWLGLAPSREPGDVGWDAAAPRFLAHARFRDRAADRSFTCVNTHFDHEGRRARRESARLVLDRLPDGPAVVLGDCNCRPMSGPYRTLTRGLADAYRVAHDRHGPGVTYVGFGGEGVEEDPEADVRAGSERIDYALVDGFDVYLYAAVADVDDAWRHPSDHLPVVADLGWIGGADGGGGTDGDGGADGGGGATGSDGAGGAQGTPD